MTVILNALYTPNLKLNAKSNMFLNTHDDAQNE